MAFDQTVKQLQPPAAHVATAVATTAAIRTQPLPATTPGTPINPYAPAVQALVVAPSRIELPLRTESSTSTARWSLAARLTSAMGDVAWQLHLRTYRKQLLLLSVAGGAVWIAGRFFLGLYVWALFAYSTFLYLLLLARLWWVRDDEGAWSWSHFAERFGAVVRDARNTFAAGERSLGALLERTKLACLAIGLALVVLAPPVSACIYTIASSLALAGESRDIVQALGQLEAWGGVLTAVGVLAWLWRGLQRRHPSVATAEFRKAVEVVAVRHDLPCFVDVREGTRSAQQIPAELVALVGILGRWRPRRANEAGYERSLVRFLEKELPGSKTFAQCPIKLEGGGRAELDVVVDDALAIELKTGLRTAAEADRAVGQLGRYSASWKHGPLMLLVCEARADFGENMIIERVRELRSLGRAVFVVAAGQFAD
jgi:hypothetical protein